MAQSSFSDKISMYALLVSGLALLVAASSAFYAAKQYGLNEARDQREREATLPSFVQYAYDKRIYMVADIDPATRSSQVSKLEIKVQNWSDRKLFVDDVVAIPYSGTVRFVWADTDGSYPGENNPKFGNFSDKLFTPFREGVGPRSSAIWRGFVVVEDDSRKKKHPLSN
jgi:hypothetical protein